MDEHSNGPVATHSRIKMMHTRPFTANAHNVTVRSQEGRTTHFPRTESGYNAAVEFAREQSLTGTDYSVWDGFDVQDYFSSGFGYSENDYLRSVVNGPNNF